MAAEPLVIYSHRIDPAGVLRVLREMAPGLVVTGTEENWSTIAIALRRGWRRRKATVWFSHDREYYSGPEFTRQMQGMQEYLARFPENENSERIMLLVQSFRFAITVHPQPQPPLDLDVTDERLEFVYAVAKHLDGATFSPYGLRDAAGRVLVHAKLDPDPQAVMPQIYRKAPPPSSLYRYQGGTMPNPPSPTSERVARRALCLGAVAWRAMLERGNDVREELERARTEFLEWVNAVGIGEELEPDEWRLLQRPVGMLDQQEAIDAEWLIEGAAVLAWALGAFELPPYDREADVSTLWTVLGLDSVDTAPEFLANPGLRPGDEVETLSRQILGIHWRLREQRLRPGMRVRDFEDTSQEAWFGKLPLDGVRFAEGDLAIGEHAVGNAPQQVLLPCMLVVEERHRAVNWLCGDDEVYSRVDTPT